MAMLTRTEIDAITGTVEVIPLTDAEIAEREEAAKIANDEIVKAEADKAKAATEKAALLAKLGITADEFKTLLG